MIYFNQLLKPIKIGNRKIGKGNPCYFVAEIGSNFDGNLNKAKKLIKAAKESGADAAKFQSFKTEELLAKEGFLKTQTFQKKWKKPVWQVYKDAELPRSWHKILNNYAKKIGIHFFMSSWDYESVDILSKLDVPAFKVGSGDITYLKLLKYIARKKKPIFLSTGASNSQEINNAIKAIRSEGNEKIILMYSVIQYPSPIEEANIRALAVLKEKFGLNIGYSDHTIGYLVPLAAITLGSCIIEKHFSLDPKSKGPDHPHSMSPKLFSEMVRQSRILEKGLGNGKLVPRKIEKETRIIQRRGLWTTKMIKKGETFTENNIKPLRPCNRISADYLESLIGKRAKKTIPLGKELKKSDF